jgi:hypothetical protein
LVCSDELLHSYSTTPTIVWSFVCSEIVGVVDNECNSWSAQTKDNTIVGVVDYECNSSSEQTSDYTIVGVVDYECNSSSEQT